MSKITNRLEGSLYPQTTSTFRCSNKECQEEKDRQTAKRIKIRDDRALEEKKRLERKSYQKMNKSAEYNK